MVNIRKFTGVAFRALDELVDRRHAHAPPSPRSSKRACGAHATDRVRRRPRLRQDHAAVVLRRRARPVAAGRHRRGGLRGRRPARQRGQHADPRRPRRPPADRPPAPRRRLPAHGARRRHRRRGPRPRSAAPSAHAVLGRARGSPRSTPGSARQALTRLRFICQLADTSSDTPDVGAQHAGDRGGRRRRPLRAHCGRPPGQRDHLRSRTLPAGPTRPSSPSPRCFSATRHGDLGLDRQPARTAWAGLAEAGHDDPRPARSRAPAAVTAPGRSS